MYNYGMKPFVFSLKKFSEEGVRWHRGCFDISYFRNNQTIKTYHNKPLDKDLNVSNSSCEDEGNYAEPSGGRYKSLCTLTFSYKFEYANDTVFFSHFAPYTYDDLEDYLYRIKKTHNPNHLDSIMRTDVLCKSIASKVNFYIKAKTILVIWLLSLKK
jgi:hypothetical protein